MNRYDYTERIKEYIQERFEGECIVEFSAKDYSYRIFLRYPLGVAFAPILTVYDSNLTRNFELEMKIISMQIEQEWLNLIHI